MHFYSGYIDNYVYFTTFVTIMDNKSDKISLEAVKVILRDRGMTFEELATKIGKERSVVYKTIANGNPSFGFIVKLMDALNVEFEALKTPKVKTLIDGFIDINGQVLRIRSMDELTAAYMRAQKIYEIDQMKTAGVNGINHILNK